MYKGNHYLSGYNQMEKKQEKGFRSVKGIDIRRGNGDGTGKLLRFHLLWSILFFAFLRSIYITI